LCAWIDKSINPPTSHWARARRWWEEAASWYGLETVHNVEMFRSCHDIIMWANVHSVCLYTSTSFYFADPTSIPIDSNSKIPSFSSISEMLSVGLSIHLTYIARSLNHSKSWRMCTIRSAPGDETYNIQQLFMNIPQKKWYKSSRTNDQVFKEAVK
jgi:hypothetical protein